MTGFVAIEMLGIEENHRREEFDCGKDTASSEVAVKVVLVDAKSEAVTDFYRHYGFMELIDVPKTLFLPIETVIKAAKRLD